MKKMFQKEYFLSKKIKNDYCLIVSGDCPIIDNNFVKLLYKNLSSKVSYDLVKFSKKVYYEALIWLKQIHGAKFTKFQNQKIFLLNIFQKFLIIKTKI